jgi:hypothetical protein
MVIMKLSRSKISTGLRKVCDETSSRHAGISFHVRYETRFWGYGGGYNDNVHVQTHEYIEVYVSNAARTNTYNNNNDVIPTVNAVSATPPPVQAYVVGVPTAPPKAEVIQSATIVAKKSPEERMRELEGMKSLLTEEEYQRKRAEILSDV